MWTLTKQSLSPCTLPSALIEHSSRSACWRKLKSCAILHSCVLSYHQPVCRNCYMYIHCQSKPKGELRPNPPKVLCIPLSYRKFWFRRYTYPVSSIKIGRDPKTTISVMTDCSMSWFGLEASWKRLIPGRFPPVEHPPHRQTTSNQPGWPPQARTFVGHPTTALHMRWVNGAC